MKSFKEKIISFWEAFAEEEGQIRNMMDNKADGQSLINFMDSILAIAFGRIYFEMGINEDDKYELILTPEGDRTKLFELEYWLEMAPEKLQDKWNFYSSKPGKSDSGFSMTMFGVTISKDDIVVYYEVDNEQQKINISIHSSVLMGIEQSQRYTMFLIFLDQFIGEIYTMEYIGYVEFVTEPKDSPIVSVPDLKNLIDTSITENGWFQTDNICEKCTGYEMEPSKDTDWQLREDIQIGYTACIPVLNAFYDKSDDFFKEYNSDGVYWGYLFYENINVPENQLITFRSEIEEEILEQVVSTNIANTIGGATGFHFSYIDFVIYDLEAFLKIARTILSKYNFEEAGYSNFNYDNQPVFFNE